MPAAKPRRKRVTSAGPLPLLTDELEFFLLSGVDLDREGFKDIPEATLKGLWREHGSRLTAEEGHGRKGIWRPFGFWKFELGIDPPRGWTQIIGKHGDQITVPIDFLYLRDNGHLTPEEEAWLAEYIRRRPRMPDGLPQGWKKETTETSDVDTPTTIL